MLNKRSNLLLVQIKAGQKPGWYIPLPLAVLDVTLASLQECLEFWQDLFPNLISIKLGRSDTKNKPKPAEIIALLIRLINEIRSYGSYELVRVEDGKNKISIRLY
jgi:hypothetical protein